MNAQGELLGEARYGLEAEREATATPRSVGLALIAGGTLGAGLGVWSTGDETARPAVCDRRQRYEHRPGCSSPMNNCPPRRFRFAAPRTRSAARLVAASYDDEELTNEDLRAIKEARSELGISWSD